MSIPKCRAWRVSYYDHNGDLITSVTTIAPTKLLARWNANEEVTGTIYFPPAVAARVKVGLIKYGK